jgi:predicted AAA+ superfamily ATPase
VYHNKRFKVVILTTTGRILTKEYAATNGGGARKKALMPNDVERILAVEEIHEQHQPK